MKDKGIEMPSLFDELEAQDGHTRERILRPPFSYHGGKTKSVKHIVPLLPVRTCYVEPFGGSGAVLFSRAPSKIEVFNDRYGGVVCFYRCLRDPKKLEKLIDWLDLTIHSREDFIDARDNWTNADDEIERAAKWYYMIRYSFGSLGRNFGRCTSSALVRFSGRIRSRLSKFPELHERLRQVTIENQNYDQCILDYDGPDTVFYIDPPYFGTYEAYYNTPAFTLEDHTNLLKLIFRLKGFVAVSGYPNDFYDKFPWDDEYSWSQVRTADPQAFREENQKDDRSGRRFRETVKELLWIKEARV